MKISQTFRITLLSLTLVCCMLAAIPALAQRGISVTTAKPIESERRVALVIGNGDYKSNPLRNPVNDARAMGRTLSTLGFEVIKGENLNKGEMQKAILRFAQKLRGSGVGLFYYAGHGVQVNGRNYLIPIGAEIPSQAFVEVSALDLNWVNAAITDARNRLNIIVLDACRDNPLPKGVRSGGKGLAITPAPKGTLIAYATAPGSTAADGSGRNGLYTSQLLKYVQTPGLPVEWVFKRVRQGVDRASGGKQIPWEHSSIVGDFYFKPGKAGQTPVAPPAAQPAKPVQMAGGPDSQADQRKAEINRLLVEADALYNAGKLTTPKGTNALEHYNRVLFLQPLNPKADEGLKNIVGKYVAWSKSRLKAGDFAKAEQFLARSEKVREGDERVLAMRDELRSAREQAESRNARSETERRRQAEEQARAEDVRRERERKDAERKRRESAGTVERSSDGRYTMASNGVITDNRTGLQWYVGPDKASSWNDAKKWFEALNADGGGWRMPSRSELDGLYQSGEGSRNMDPVFKTTGWCVWSGETRGPSNAWFFDFASGTENWGLRTNDRFRRFFAVRRSNSIKAPAFNAKHKTQKRFTKTYNDVITDTKTGLEWFVGPTKDYSWGNARNWVEGLSLAGGGWRMPSRNELRGLYQKGEGSRNMDPTFKTPGWRVWSGWYVWSGETSGTSSAWLFNFNSGNEVRNLRKHLSNGVRAFAVRFPK